MLYKEFIADEKIEKGDLVCIDNYFNGMGHIKKVKSEVSKKYIVGRDFAAHLIELLGLPNKTNSFTINVNLDDLVTINCRYFLKTDEKKLNEFFKQYYLIKKETKT